MTARHIYTVGMVLALCAAGCGSEGEDEVEAGQDGSGGAIGGAGGRGGAAGAAGKSTGSGGTKGGAGGASVGTGGASSGAGGSTTGTGGATHGVGGSADAGAGGSVPHTTGDCGTLGAIEQWQAVTPPLDSVNILTVRLDPTHGGTVYAGTDRRGLWRSTDCGASWTKASTGRGGDILDSGGLWDVTIDPSRPEHIWVATSYGSYAGLMHSSNRGVDWDRGIAQGSPALQGLEYDFFQSLGMDPTDPAHMLGTFHSGCYGGNQPGCLAETFDSGQTWRQLRAPYHYWIEAAGPLIMAGPFMIVHSVLDGVWYTQDAGASWNKVTGMDGSGFQTHRATDGYLYIGGQRGIHRTLDGIHWDLESGLMGWGLVGDGVRMFTATRWGGTHFYHRAEAGGTWTELPGAVAPNVAHESSSFAYDADHHLLYVAHREDGLFRMVTR